MTLQLPNNIAKAVDYIISTENYDTSPEIEVIKGSDAGDGYTSRNCMISLKGKVGETVEFFVKYLPEPSSEEWRRKSFLGEMRFYEQVYPAVVKFQEKKKLKDPFNNVPKYYELNLLKDSDSSIVVLENIKSLGYVLKDMKEPINDDHLKLFIQALAKYHAICYAMKDQEPDEFQNICMGTYDTFIDNFLTFGMDAIVDTCVEQFLESLDPNFDKHILNKCINLSEILTEHTSSLPQFADEYSVLCHGDCWSNNVMFLYDDKSNSPKDVKLLDWQCQKVISPLLDFSYFFYTSATKEILDNADYYLQLYYDVLSERIKGLGSNPEKMYPREIFLQHWKRFALFGLTLALSIVKGQLFEEDEVPNSISCDGKLSVEPFAIKIKRHDEYIKRIRNLVEYFIDKDLI